MIAFDPRSGKVREFVLYQGDVFEAGGDVFLVTVSVDMSLRVVDEMGRSRSVSECELYVSEKGAIPEMVRHIGAWRDES